MRDNCRHYISLRERLFHFLFKSSVCCILFSILWPVLFRLENRIFVLETGGLSSVHGKLLLSSSRSYYGPRSKSFVKEVPDQEPHCLCQKNVTMLVFYREITITQKAPTVCIWKDGISPWVRHLFQKMLTSTHECPNTERNWPQMPHVLPFFLPIPWSVHYHSSPTVSPKRKTKLRLSLTLKETQVSQRDYGVVFIPFAVMRP